MAIVLGRDMIRRAVYARSLTHPHDGRRRTQCTRMCAREYVLDYMWYHEWFSEQGTKQSKQRKNPTCSHTQFTLHTLFFTFCSLCFVRSFDSSSCLQMRCRRRRRLMMFCTMKFNGAKKENWTNILLQNKIAPVLWQMCFFFSSFRFIRFGLYQ